MNFEDLKGQILIKIENKEDEIIFTTDTGRQYKQYHEQHCCENVRVEEIIGDINDILHFPILLAEEVVYENKNPKDMPSFDYEPESFTWTFYKLVTNKGGITIRWLGESNGYYSESVDFCEIINE